MSDVVSKKNLLASLEEMPEQIRVDELIENARLLSKIERGIKSSEEGRNIPHEEVKKIVAGWFE